MQQEQSGGELTVMYQSISYTSGTPQEHRTVILLEPPRSIALGRLSRLEHQCAQGCLDLDGVGILNEQQSGQHLSSFVYICLHSAHCCKGSCLHPEAPKYFVCLRQLLSTSPPSIVLSQLCKRVYRRCILFVGEVSYIGGGAQEFVAVERVAEFSDLEREEEVMPCRFSHMYLSGHMATHLTSSLRNE